MKNRYLYRKLTAVLLAAALMTGCGGASPKPPGEDVVPLEEREDPEEEIPEEEPGEEPGGDEEENDMYELKQEKLAELRAFYLDTAPVFLGAEDGKNHIYSPVNVYLALGLLAEVTDTETRQQILDALHTKSLEDVEDRTAALWEGLSQDSERAKCLLGNSLWIDDAGSYRKETADRMEEKLHASVFAGEMGSAEMNEAFHDWLNEMTGDLLKDQTQSLSFDPDTIAALASTIWLKARWSDPFEESFTAPDTFHGAGGDTQADFMHASGIGTLYMGENFTVYEKYLIGAGSMLFILPAEGVSPEALLEDEELGRFLTMEDPWEWENTKSAMIHASIPKFDLTTSLDLVPGLKALGIEKVFDTETSDFSPLTDASGICIDRAVHNARVKIDEEGIEAAAYTAMMAAGAALVEEEAYFTLDRPFVFAVRSMDGVPLFTGVVNQAG